jgi:general secretion pathway protein A
MVLDFYKLREDPFGVTPDSRYLFLSASHQEALATLLYGIEAGRGFTALIARPGMGKTTLLFHALSHLRGKATTIFLFQTISNPADLLRAILTDLGVREMPESPVWMQMRLNELLVEQARLGQRVVVAIDEAQNLDDSVLELVRMLSNFESSREKLIQIILSGQPQLAERIASPELVQLRQRISMFACLHPFTSNVTQLYIDHRLRIAGYGLETPLFTNEALALIAQHSEGIPRNINNLCFNSLSLGYALKRKTVDGEIIREVVADLDLDRWGKKTSLGERPQETRVELAPASLLSLCAPSRLGEWTTRIALAVAVLLLLSVGLFQSRRWWTSEPAVLANRPIPPVAVAEQPVFSGTRTTAAASAALGADSAERPLPPAFRSFPTNQQVQPEASTRTVRVMPGETLLNICTENLGECSPELLGEIRRLNPLLSNPDHIEPGQSIRLPLSGIAQNRTRGQNKALLAEGGRDE